MDEATRDEALVLLPRPDGTAGFIEAGAIRALMGYIAQRDAEIGEAPCTECGTSGADCLDRMNSDRSQPRCCHACGLVDTHRP